MARILLADDSRFFRTIERQFLQKTPAELDEATSSDELLTKARSSTTDLIFVGFTLRPNNAAECCRQIKRDPALKTLPVVIICDQGDAAQLEEAKRAGADLVGMSTVPEAIALRHMGVRVGGISLVTNHAAGTTDEPPSHEEVTRIAVEARDRFTGLLDALLPRIATPD